MKYIKLFEQEYSMYDIITMTPDNAGKILVKECSKESPNMELIQNIVEHSLVDINWETIGGWTAIMTASWEGHTEIVKLLLERPEIDVNLKDEEWDRTALMLASLNCRTEIVRVLLERPEIRVNLQSKRGETARIRLS